MLFRSGLTSDTRDIPYMYKGEATVLRKISGDFCSSCNEIIFTMPQLDYYSNAIDTFQKHVNASLFDSSFISTIRKKLSLDQKEAGEIFGGGINAFSRYETGKTKPPVALIKLLKVLDKHPDLLNEVRAI